MTKDLKKILFVDDDEDIHLIVRMCLQEIPELDLQSAFSGEEGIKIAMEFHPDLILLDVMMPIMDGISTLQALNLIPIFAKTPIIFVTAKAQKSEIESYFKLGVFDVIVKPFDPLTFAQNVQQIWDKYQQMHQ